MHIVYLIDVCKQQNLFWRWPVGGPVGKGTGSHTEMLVRSPQTVKNFTLAFLPRVHSALQNEYCPYL